MRLRKKTIFMSVILTADGVFESVDVCGKDAGGITAKPLICAEDRASERQNRQNFLASGGCNGHTEEADQNGRVLNVH